MGQLRSLCLLATGSLIVLSSCGQVQYHYGERTFYKSDDVLEVLKIDLEKEQAEIASVSNPAGGRATIVLASQQRWREKGIVIWGKTSEKNKQKMVDFTAEQLFMRHVSLAETVKRGEVFDEVAVLNSEDPATTQESAAGQYVLWFDLQDANTGQWYVRRAGSSSARAVPMDSGVPVTERTQKWLQTLNDTIWSLGSQ